MTTADDETDIIYRLADDCTRDDLDFDRWYLGTVNGVVDYGVFVDLSDAVSGLVHSSNLENDYDVGDEIVVAIEEERQNGDIALDEVAVETQQHRIEEVYHDFDITSITDLTGYVGETVHLQGQVIQIKQTDGPTIFHVNDGNGIIPCTAFVDPGVRAYPEIELDAYVRATGTVERRDESLQVELTDLTIIRDEKQSAVADRINAAISETAEPADVDPLIDWDALDKIYPDLHEVAQMLRRSVLEGRPIRIRHHADGDGMCASVPVYQALRSFINSYHLDEDAHQHLLRRLPSKAPFYEMEDSTRDLSHALEDRQRHGQKLPLLLMLDNGSTEEDTPAYETLRHYDVPIIVVDHHHPDPDAVDPLLEAHVNPYLHGEDYRVTTGMMSVELARMIDPSLTENLEHIPAVAGLADRSSAETMNDYLSLAADAGYEKATLENIGEALDYAAHWLRYNDGGYLIEDVLNLSGNDKQHQELVSLLSDQAQKAVNEQLDVALSHVEHQTLPNGIDLYQIDVDEYARRFEYPAPGKTTGAIHDQKVKENDTPAITIGYGPDFAVLRSDGVRLDIPTMVAELNEEIPGAGISGGGHLVVGSVKFVEGRRDEVLSALVEKMADAEIDEQVGSTTSAM